MGVSGRVKSVPAPSIQSRRDICSDLEGRGAAEGPWECQQKPWGSASAIQKAS